MSASIGYDSTVFIDRSIENVFKTILEAIGLVLLIVLLPIGLVITTATLEGLSLIDQLQLADVRASPDDASPIVFRAEQNVLLELAEPALSAASTARPGWVKVRHRDGQVGFVRIAQVFGL